MNCKPGDMALIVKTHHETESCLGRIVSLISPFVLDGELVWTYREMPLRGKYQSGSWRWIELPDAWLRPIRDPGDDAADESAAWLPPVKEAADVAH